MYLYIYILYVYTYIYIYFFFFFKKRKYLGYCHYKCHCCYDLVKVNKKRQNKIRGTTLFFFWLGASFIARIYSSLDEIRKCYQLYTLQREVYNLP